MPVKIYWIETFANGARVGIMARPRGNEWLGDEVMSLKKQRVQLLVSLLESTEIDELGLWQEEALAHENGIGFINFPITDRSIPKYEKKTDSFLGLLSSKIEEGQSVVVHCRMGIGRASIIAGCVLVQKGHLASNIIQKISSVRGLKVPDTEEQVAWLRKREIIR